MAWTKRSLCESAAESATRYTGTQPSASAFAAWMEQFSFTSGD